MRHEVDHSPPLPGLRMSGAIPLFSLYACTGCTGMVAFLSCECPVSFRVFFFSPKHPDCLRGSLNPPFNGYWGSLLGVKWTGSENHSPPYGAEVEIE